MTHHSPRSAGPQSSAASTESTSLRRSAAAPARHPGTGGSKAAKTSARGAALPTLRPGLTVRSARDLEVADHAGDPLPRWRPPLPETLILSSAARQRQVLGSPVSLDSLQLTSTLCTESDRLRRLAQGFKLTLGELACITTREGAVAYDEQQTMHWDARWGLVPGLSPDPDAPHLSTSNRTLQIALTTEFVTAQIPVTGRGLRQCSPEQLAAVRLPGMAELRGATGHLVTWSGTKEGTPQARGWRELCRRMMTRVMLESCQPAWSPTEQDGPSRQIGLIDTVSAQELLALSPQLVGWAPGPRDAGLESVADLGVQVWLAHILGEDLILERGRPLR